LQAQGGGDGLQGPRLQGDLLQKNNVRVEVTVEAGEAGQVTKAVGVQGEK
jgi:hypothetical protein